MAGLPTSYLVRLTEAAELYTDHFLAGFTVEDAPAFDDWQFFQQEGLRRMAAQVLDQLQYSSAERHEYVAAIEFPRRLLGLDSLHEPAHRRLMQLYFWSNQQAAAIRQYQECVRILDDELGVPPEDETTELFEAIRTKRYALPEPKTQTVAGPLPGQSQDAFVPNG